MNTYINISTHLGNNNFSVPNRWMSYACLHCWMNILTATSYRKLSIHQGTRGFVASNRGIHEIKPATFETPAVSVEVLIAVLLFGMPPRDKRPHLPCPNPGNSTLLRAALQVHWASGLPWKTPSLLGRRKDRDLGLAQCDPQQWCDTNQPSGDLVHPCNWEILHDQQIVGKRTWVHPQSRVNHRPWGQHQFHLISSNFLVKYGRVLVGKP